MLFFIDTNVAIIGQTAKSRVTPRLRDCLNLYDTDFERACQMDFWLRWRSVAVATWLKSEQKDADKHLKSKVI